MRRTLLIQIYPLYLVAILLAIGALTITATRLFRSALYSEKETELHNMALLLHNHLATADPAAWSEPARPEPATSESARPEAFSLEATIRTLARDLPVRITLIDPRGTVLVDTHLAAEQAENHAGRPEIAAALSGELGTAVRVSGSTGENSLYVAIGVHDAQGNLVGVVRTAGSVERIRGRVGDVFSAVVVAGLLIMAATIGLTLVIMERLHRPLEAIRGGAQRFAAGQLDHRINVRTPREIGSVAETLNSMASQLERTIADITTQRNELDAILTGMVEGVIVVDEQRRIRSINRAALRLFHVDHSGVRGSSVIEALRNAEIDQLAEQVLASGSAREASITLYERELLHIFVHATPLPGKDTGGVLLVLNDITRLKRLENIRRDFVANVSHELRTPVTTILGFVETLRDGALHDPDSAERFIEIIHSHSTRLNLIIEDLLSLSRLESYDTEIPLEPCDMQTIITKTVQACEREAERKGITIARPTPQGDAEGSAHGGAAEGSAEGSVDGAAEGSAHGAAEGGLTVVANAPLLEQALVNLLDNAIKYSPSGSRVEIEAELRRPGDEAATPTPTHGSTRPTGAAAPDSRPSRSAEARDSHLRHSAETPRDDSAAGGQAQLVVRVRDFGVGIPRRDLTRVFERFYRVDRARSRDMGGTGLGLAIVKHIALAHHGEVTVESTEGRGSTFTLTIPQP